MSLWKRIWHALTAFFYLRFYELLCGVLVLAIIFYFSNSISGASDWRQAPRPLYALVSAFGVIGIYYILFKYLLASLLTTLALGMTPYFRRVPLTAVNSLTYAAHALWIMHFNLHPASGWPLSIWVTWAIIVAFDFVSPFLLPSRLFGDRAASHAAS